MSESVSEENVTHTAVLLESEECKATLEEKDEKPCELKHEPCTESIAKDAVQNSTEVQCNQLKNKTEVKEAATEAITIATTTTITSTNSACAADTDAAITEPEAMQTTEEMLQQSNEHESVEHEKNIKEEAEAAKNDTAATQKPSTASNSTTPGDEYEEHITYTDDGNAIYTDPKTNHQYKWCAEKNNWVYWKSGDGTDSTNAASENPFENEHYKWCSERNQWIPKAQATDATTRTQTETEHYKWDAAQNAWIPKVQTQQAAAATTPTTATAKPDVIYGIDEDGQRIYTDKDGVVFFWDAQKSAWFPKIDDDFMARYQMNYGFIDNTSAGEQERKLKEEAEVARKAVELQQMADEARAATEATAAGVGGATGGVGVKRKVALEPPKWFELNPEQNTKVYVSNLPLDITQDEFAEVMSKCGMIMRDPQTQKYKLKLYTEADGQIKGDGLCDYIKVESVDLALKILDEYEVRGHKIRVQRAKFQMRGEYNPALKPKRKKKDKEKVHKMKEKLFDWRPEKMRGERSKNEKVVIIKNLFQPETFEKEVQLILDYQNDLREECGKCGSVRKVVIYDLHAEGVAQVNMSCPEEADLVIQMMHGRYFGKRQLTAEHWDGKTKYKIAETESAAKSRLTNWDQYLETDEEKKEEQRKSAACEPASESAAQELSLD